MINPALNYNLTKGCRHSKTHLLLDILLTLLHIDIFVLVVVFGGEGVESEAGHVGEEEEHGVRLEEPHALPHHFGGALV